MKLYAPQVAALLVMLLAGALTVEAHTPFHVDADPVQEPDRFAWELFAYVNQPSDPVGSNVTWETWISTRQLFKDPNTKPIWPRESTRVFDLTAVTQSMMVTQQLQSLNIDAGSVPKPDKCGVQEVHVDPSTFKFIVENDLWYLEGQEAAAREGRSIVFPKESLEIKAVWKPLDPKKDDPRKFHLQHHPCNGLTYGLIALHITSKRLPNWFWATFEHRSNPQRCELPCVDTFGAIPKEGMSPEPTPALRALFRKAGLGAEWKYYMLEGHQIDFVNSTGQSLILGNPSIEIGFASESSCITCHSRATVNSLGKRLDLVDATGHVFTGAPDPLWFYATPAGTAEEPRKFLQMDFVWSLCHAKSRTGRPSPCPDFP